MMFGVLFFSVNNVVAQQQTTTPPLTQTSVVVSEPVKEQIQEQAKETVAAQTLPLDITTITGILGTAGGLLWKDRKDKQDLEKQLKECMDILMNLEVCGIKVFNAAILYPEKNIKQLLELKVNNNAMENQTIAGEMSVHIARLQKFMMINFHTMMPNMSVASQQVINATTTVPANKVAEITPPNPEPATK